MRRPPSGVRRTGVAAIGTSLGAQTDCCCRRGAGRRVALLPLAYLGRTHRRGRRHDRRRGTVHRPRRRPGRTNRGARGGGDRRLRRASGWARRSSSLAPICPRGALFAVLAALPLAVPDVHRRRSPGVSTLRRLRRLLGRRAGSDALLLPVRVPAGRGRAAPAPIRRQEEVARSLGPQPVADLRRRHRCPGCDRRSPAARCWSRCTCFSDFGAVSLLRTDTFTRAIFTAFDLGFDRTGALVLCDRPGRADHRVARRRRALTRRRDARYARGRSRSTPPAHPGSTRAVARWPAALLLAGIAALALGVPALNLVRRLVGRGVAARLARRHRRRGGQLAGHRGDRRGPHHRCWPCRSGCSSARAARQRSRRPWTGSAT